MLPIYKNYTSMLISFLRSTILTISYTRTGDLVFKVLNDSFYIFVYFLKFFGLALFQFLNEYTCVDYPQKKKRFELILQLTSFQYNNSLRIKSPINELTSVKSLTSLFKSSNWPEREIFDLYGINFYNHNDLRRILTDYGFIGFPFRKDFPLSGFLSARYNNLIKRVSFENNNFNQEFRLFYATSSWNNTSL